MRWIVKRVPRRLLSCACRGAWGRRAARTWAAAWPRAWCRTASWPTPAEGATSLAAWSTAASECSRGHRSHAERFAPACEAFPPQRGGAAAGTGRRTAVRTTDVACGFACARAPACRAGAAGPLLKAPAEEGGPPLVVVCVTSDGRLWQWLAQVPRTPRRSYTPTSPLLQHAQGKSGDVALFLFLSLCHLPRVFVRVVAPLRSLPCSPARGSGRAELSNHPHRPRHAAQAPRSSPPAPPRPSPPWHPPSPPCASCSRPASRAPPCSRCRCSPAAPPGCRTSCGNPRRPRPPSSSRRRRCCPRWRRPPPQAAQKPPQVRVLPLPLAQGRFLQRMGAACWGRHITSQRRAEPVSTPFASLLGTLARRPQAA